MPREGWTAGVAAVVLAVVALDAAMLAWVVPAGRVAGWDLPWTLGLIVVIDAIIATLVSDIRGLPDLPEGGRLLPLMSIWRRACWLLCLLMACLILVGHPAVFDLR